MPTTWKSTCSGCDATWTALNTCHCSATGCHRTFSGVTSFDMHRRNGRCLDPADLKLKLDGDIWRHPGTDSRFDPR